MVASGKPFRKIKRLSAFLSRLGVESCICQAERDRRGDREMATVTGIYKAFRGGYAVMVNENGVARFLDWSGDRAPVVGETIRYQIIGRNVWALAVEFDGEYK